MQSEPRGTYTDRRTLSAASGAGHWHGVDGGVVFDVEGFEDVTAVGATIHNFCESLVDFWSIFGPNEGGGRLGYAR